MLYRSYNILHNDHKMKFTKTVKNLHFYIPTKSFLPATKHTLYYRGPRQGFLRISPWKEALERLDSGLIAFVIKANPIFHFVLCMTFSLTVIIMSNFPLGEMELIHLAIRLSVVKVAWTIIKYFILRVGKICWKNSFPSATKMQEKGLSFSLEESHFSFSEWINAIFSQIKI